LRKNAATLKVSGFFIGGTVEAFNYTEFRQGFIDKRRTRQQRPVVDLTPSVDHAGKIVLFYDTRTARWLERQIRKMAYGDALTIRGYRLEYLCPPVGFIHFRLYRSRTLIGIQYVRSPNWLMPVQRGLAAYLALIGFNHANTVLKVGGARTPLSAKTNRLPKLVDIDCVQQPSKQTPVTPAETVQMPSRN
jgi:hypothetical protein